MIELSIHGWGVSNCRSDPPLLTLLHSERLRLATSQVSRSHFSQVCRVLAHPAYGRPGERDAVGIGARGASCDDGAPHRFSLLA